MICEHAFLRSISAGACVLCDRLPDPESDWADGVYDGRARPAAPEHTDDEAEVAELKRDELDIEASILRDSFADFAEFFWPVMTGLPYPDNTATRALCAAFQAVADGRIWRLLVAISPGIGKSTMLALYSAWRLARRADWRGLHAMAAAADANRESLRVRRLVLHEEFQRRWPIELQEDEQAVGAWATKPGGRYYALGRDSAVTSKRVLEEIVDDPMTAGERYSKASRDEVWVWLDESLKSRLDGDRAPIIIVAQRLDRDDIHARCLASGEPWVFLEPAAERDGRGLELRDHAGALVWRDTRQPGEIIAPQMLSREKLAGLSKSVRMTQYQQRPEEDDGGASIGRGAWGWHAPAGADPNAKRPYGCATPEQRPTVVTPDRFERIVISIDPTFGGTKTSNDFASITVWGALGPGRYRLARWKKRAKQREQRDQIKVFAKQFPTAAIIIERAAGGDGMIEELTAPTQTGGDGFKLCPKGQHARAGEVEGITVGSATGGKAARLDNVSPGIDQGFVYLSIGDPKEQEFVDELAGMTSHDDEMDSTSQALHWLNTAGSTDAQELERRTAAMRTLAARFRRPGHGRAPYVLGGGHDDPDGVTVVRDLRLNKRIVLPRPVCAPRARPDTSDEVGVCPDQP
jgi:phage terminase large subunit-like protein